MMTEIEREPEYREPRNITRTRNMKLEIPKTVAAVESPLKQNGEETLYSASYSPSISISVTSDLFPVAYEQVQ